MNVFIETHLKVLQCIKFAFAEAARQKACGHLNSCLNDTLSAESCDWWKIKRERTCSKLARFLRTYDTVITLCFKASRNTVSTHTFQGGPGWRGGLISLTPAD